MTTLIVIGLAFWAICGILAYGIYKKNLKLFYEKYEYMGYSWNDEVFAIIDVFLGLLGLIHVFRYFTGFGKKVEIGLCFLMPRELTQKHRSSPAYIDAHPLVSRRG